MNTYMLSVCLQIEVQAFDEKDARGAVDDAFGPGETCGLNVVDCEIVDVAELG